MKHIILPSLVHTCLISGMPLRKDQFVLKLKSPTLVIEYSQDDVRYFMCDMTLNSNLIISSQEQVYSFQARVVFIFCALSRVCTWLEMIRKEESVCKWRIYQTQHLKNKVTLSLNTEKLQIMKRR